jgi:hypothetical protein
MIIDPRTPRDITICRCPDCVAAGKPFVNPEWDTFRAALLRLTLTQAVEWAALLDDEIESVEEGA